MATRKETNDDDASDEASGTGNLEYPVVRRQWPTRFAGSDEKGTYQMSVQVAVLDPVPVYRYGLLGILGCYGFDAKAPDELLQWATQDQQRVVLLTVQRSDDWTLLARLRQQSPGLTIVAVLTDPDVHTYVKAILAGAVTAVPRDAPPEIIKQVFEEAVRGTSLLPIEVVRALAAFGEQSRLRPEMLTSPQAGERRVGGATTSLPPHEAEWLRDLAGGLTVTQLAEKTGYSQRAMFRRLRDLYVKLHVRNRTEALIYAQQQGWL